jgi:hypothetical protein
MPQTCPPDPSRTRFQFQYRRWVGHVPQKNCWCSWRVALKTSMVLKRPLTLTSNCGPRKYHRAHLWSVSWCFAVSKEGLSGHSLFLSRTEPPTLVAIIRDWVEPGTTGISDCWGAYRYLDRQGFTHRTVRLPTSPSTSKIQTSGPTPKQSCPRGAASVLLGQNGGKLPLPPGTFAMRYKVLGVPPFVHFLDLFAKRLVSVWCASLLCPRHVTIHLWYTAMLTRLLLQVVTIFRLEFWDSFFLKPGITNDSYGPLISYFPS